METFRAVGAGVPTLPADVVACTPPYARVRKKKVPANSRRAPQKSCFMFAKREPKREAICVEGAIVGEGGDGE